MMSHYNTLITHTHPYTYTRMKELFNSDEISFFLFSLAIIPISIYLVWSIKNLMKEIVQNIKGGEYK